MKGARELERVDVVQAILDRRRRGAYLEIGVKTGDTFLRIKARRKLAVDPALRISLQRKLYWLRRNPWNVFNRYYEVTSDAFFARRKALMVGPLLDVVFVDGLHTYSQSLRDIENSLRVLKADGVIVVDDCNPGSKAAALPANSPDEVARLNLPDWTGAWCGDVWKTIAHLRATRSDLRVSVLEAAYGLGLITRGAPESRLDLDPAIIESLPYEHFATHREQTLNLKPTSYLEDFLSSL